MNILAEKGIKLAMQNDFSKKLQAINAQNQRKLDKMERAHHKK